MAAQPVQGVLNELLGKAVQRVGRFIEEQDLRSAEERSYHRDPLLSREPPIPKRGDTTVLNRDRIFQMPRPDQVLTPYSPPTKWVNSTELA